MGNGLYDLNKQNYADYTSYKEQSREASNYRAYASLASDFAGIAGSFVDYSTLKANLKNYYVQADQVELQAQQRANQLREQFNTSVGSYTVGAAQRGISVNSGSVRSNVEASAIAMGKDIQKAQENASMQANALRKQAKIEKSSGKAKLYSSIGSGLLNMGMTAASLGAFDNGITESGGVTSSFSKTSRG